MCRQCEQNPVYEFTNKRRLCARCFVRYFEKKVLYTIKKFNMAHQGDTLFYEPQKDLRNIVLEESLKMFSEKAGVKLITAAGKDKNYKTIIPSTLDSEADEIVREIISGDIKNLKGRLAPFEKTRQGIILRPLYLFLDEEVLLYARLKKLKFKEHKPKKDKLVSFVEGLEKKHPEIKRAIVNGWLKINSS